MSGLCRCLAIWGQNETLYFLLPRSVQKSPNATDCASSNCCPFATIFHFFVSERRVLSLRNCWSWTER